MATRPRPEALLYCAIAAAGLGPVVAHTLWRPLTAALGADPSGVAYPVSIAATAVGLLATLATLATDRRQIMRAATVGIAGLIGLAIGGGLPAVVALLATSGAALWAAPRILRGLPATLAWTGRRRVIALVVGLVIGVPGAIATMQVSAFMADAACMRFAQPPGIEFYHSHACMTAYVHAAELLRAGVTNVYDLAWVPTGAMAAEVPTAAHMAPFELDRYGYPPQFLLVPLALSAVAPDFAAHRALWFGLNGLLFAYALWSLAIWVGPRGGRLAVLGAPLMWILSLVTLQSGNAHLGVMAIALLGVRALHDRRDRLGGGLLAAATLAKIAPGLLGVVLLVQRRWRAVGWTLAWAVALSALTWAVIGWGPFAAFFDVHLPGIRSGAAYDFLDDDLLTIVTNWSPFSLPFKLDALGVGIDGWRWGPPISTGFTVLAFALTALGARRIHDRRSALAIGMAILTLASMRSPMAAPYVTITGFWALLLLAAEPPGVGRRVACAGLIGLLGWSLALIAQSGPGAFGPVIMLGSLVGILLFVALMAYLLLRRWPPLDP